jgi:hypothetical protein
MMLNNPSWRFLDEPCPIASLTSGQRRTAARNMITQVAGTTRSLLVSFPGPMPKYCD